MTILHALAALMLAHFALVGWNSVVSTGADPLDGTDPQHRGSRATVSFHGEITGPAVANLLMELANARSSLVISSQGGDPAAALDLAEFVRDHDVEVVIDSYCFSECASIVFASAHERVLAPGALLGFGITESSSQAVIQSLHNPDRFSTGYILSKREQALYVSVGLDTKWLLIPHSMLGSDCYSVRYVTEDRFDLYMPTDGELRRAGFQYTGALPQSHRDAVDAARMINRKVRRSYAWRLAVDEPGAALSKLNPSAELGSLPRCEQDPRRQIRTHG